MELFLPLPGIWSKKFVQKIVFIFTNEFYIDFQQKMELSKQGMELFLSLSGLWSKIFFYKFFFLFFTTEVKLKADWLTYWQTFSSVPPFGPILTYMDQFDKSGPNQISSQLVQDLACCTLSFNMDQN